MLHEALPPDAAPESPVLNLPPFVPFPSPTKSTVRVKVQELEDQVRDIMFFIEARDKIENGEGAASEAAGGSLEVASPPPQNGSARKKRGKR